MMHINTYLLLIASFAAERAYASCAYGTHLHARAEEGEAVKVNTFGYTGAISPLNWLALDPAANTACATGQNQSPIDMTADQFTVISAADVSLNIPDIEETEIENLGTTVEVVVPEGTNATMTSGGTVFNMKQFHFHLPSEHLDAGRSFAMEMHMVFESADGKIAVLGNYLDTANGANVNPAAGAAGNATAAAKRRHARDVLSKRQVQVVRLGAEAGAGAETPATSSTTQSVLDTLLALLGGAASGNAAAGAATGGTAGVATGEKIESTNGAAAAEGAAGAATGAAAAVGVETGGSTLINTVWDSAGQVATPGTKAKIGPLVMSGLADSIKAASLQTYQGSLTTPPCSEGVSWFVSTQKQTVSLSTFETARDIIGFNSRFPQNKLGQPNVLALAASATNGAAAAAAAAKAA